jgi:hypothetical protein
MITIKRARTAALFLPVCFLACGCRQGIDRVPCEQDKIAQLQLMLPCKIEIQPFTSIRSFDEDDIPDGILLVLRPVDSLGDPVKAAGQFYFELWTFVEASGEPKGERLAFWERCINTEQDMRLYWTHAQMFEFQLAWVGQGAGKIEPGKKFVLRAVWRTPWDTTLTDEYILNFNLPFGALTSQPAELSPGNAATQPAPAAKPSRGARRRSRS